MAPTEIIERLDGLKRASKPIGQITVTDLARSNAWRTELPKVGVMQITDRGQTAGWLVSEKDIEAIVYAIVDLEEELERASVDALFKTRNSESLESWKSGKELETTALAYLEERGDEIAMVIDEHK